MPQPLRRLVSGVSFLALSLLGGGLPSPLIAQCNLNAPLYKFSPTGSALGYGPSGHFLSGFATDLNVFSVGTSPRLILREDFGYTLFDLSSPAAPVMSGTQDIEGFQGTFTKVGDGFSTITTATA